jgi:hypothetical protein
MTLSEICARVYGTNCKKYSRTTETSLVPVLTCPGRALIRTWPLLRAVLRIGGNA